MYIDTKITWKECDIAESFRYCDFFINVQLPILGCIFLDGVF